MISLNQTALQKTCELQANYWKYLSLGLVVILAVGFIPSSVMGAKPPDFRDTVVSLLNSLSNTLNSINDSVVQINTKTTNLPDDPADQSEIIAALGNIQTGSAGGFTQIIMEKTVANNLNEEAIISCTSDHDFLIDFKANTNSEGQFIVYRNDISYYSETLVVALHTPSSGMTVGGNANENLAISVFNLTDFAPTSLVVVLRTTEGAVASCTVNSIQW